TNMYGVLRTFRVEDFIKAKDATSSDCLPSMPNTVCEHVGSGIISQVPGTAYVAGIATSMVTADRVEAIPRKLKVVVGDAEPVDYSRADFMTTFNASGAADAGGGLKKFNARVPATTDFKYRIQRITVENLSLGLRWSADAKAQDGTPTLGEAEFTGILAGASDTLRVTRNYSTHAVVTLFGFGIGVFDVNAIESNDADNQITGIRPEKMPREQVALRHKAYDNAALAPDGSINDLSFSPESEIAAITIPGDASTTPPTPDEQSLRVYTLDARKGVVQFTFVPPGAPRRAGELLLNDDNERYAPLHAAAGTSLRLSSLALYTNAQNKSYLLVPALQHGLLVVAAGTEPLDPSSFADVIWSPAGAYAVRVVPGTNMAVIINRDGYAQLVDLTRIDEREVDGTATTGLFPTAQAAIAAGAPDPRIIWTSANPVAEGTGFIPPIVDGDTGMMITASLLRRDMQVHSVVDPKFRVMADVGDPKGLREVGSIVPLGIEPPKKSLKCETAATDATCHASLGVFRVEATLPGSLDESLGGELKLAIESERVAGVPAPQTAAPYPVAHLRRNTPAGSPDSRPTTVTMKRLLPEIPELRYQKGYNRFVSDWIVAIADPRAGKDYGTVTNCDACKRPQYLGSLTDVRDLYTVGRFVSIRTDVSGGGPYAYLGTNNRLRTRVSTVPADTVRPSVALVAAQNPPVAEGLLQDTTYMHSGEVETSSIDLDAGGRAGWNVLVDRTYRSRTIGLTPLGSGWDSALFRRLRALPNGDVEYRDGAEVWRFKLGGGTYVAPQGLSLRLVKRDGGWNLIDQQLRITSFDELGRLATESDEFYQPREAGSGNTISYVYDSQGRLTHVVDPLGRATTLTYDDTTGLLKKITEWHDATPRSIDYVYEDGRLTEAKLPVVVNVDGTRPTLRYTYEAAGSGYKEALELGTNLDTITDAGMNTPRVDFTYDSSSDRVLSQKWATGESASFTWSLPDTATVTDVLGQSRKYTLTGANSTTDPFADRAHAKTIEEQVEVWAGASAGQLPVSVSAGPASRTTATRTRNFEYENGLLEHSELVGVSSTDNGYTTAGNAPGQVLSTSTTTPLNTASANPVVPPSAAIARAFHYHGPGAFLKDIEAGGRRIDSPQPHRDYRTAEASNDSISSTQTFDSHGVLKTTSSSNGTDTTGAGSAGEIRYWEETDPKYKRGLPRLTRSGTLETRIDYPDETHVRSIDAAGVITTTELDTWNRPKSVTISKPGDPLVITESYQYEASGRLHSITRARAAGDVTTTYEYDLMGRQKSVTTNQIASVNTAATTTQTDLGSRKIVTTAPGGAVTTVELDRLGRTIRSVTDTGSSPIEQQFAYDLAGNRVFVTDMLTASATAYDAHGRPVATRNADGTISTTTFDDWGNATASKELSNDATPQIVAESHFDFTPAGRLKKLENRVDAARTLTTNFAWDGGGRTTAVAANGRASRMKFDLGGRLQTSEAGAGDLAAISEIFSKTTVTDHDGLQPTTTVMQEKGGASYTAFTAHDTAGDVKQQSVGPLTWKQTYDELGNVTEASVPGRPSTKWDVDARGNAKSETLPDGAQNQFEYHGSGAQSKYIDPSTEDTRTTTDRIGRPTRRDYKDGSFEIMEWEGSRLKSVTDRQQRKQVYKYNGAGQLEFIEDATGARLDELHYDTAGRLISWKNADSELTWSGFDLQGHPTTTTQKRFANGDGLTSSSPVVLDTYTQTHTWNEHGERSDYTMPAAAGMTFQAGWAQSVHHDYDAMGNLIAITCGTRQLMSAQYRNAGRADSRTVTTAGNATILRSYGYDPASSLLKRMLVQSNGIAIAGSEVDYDGLQIRSTQLLGVSSDQRYSQFRYDDRSRLRASVAGAAADANPFAAVPGRSLQALTPADFRSADERQSHFDTATAAALQAKRVDTTTIDPPSKTFSELPGGGHKIEQVTRGSRTFVFGWNNGSERIDDGRFTYDF
ncbi:MAG: hypothetical protein M3Q69_13300, partial [Acidobacteriota bacterium]|nr:hypothetical protein [Acidobacteriota bacterium]